MICFIDKETEYPTMPKNIKGGKGAKKQKNSANRPTQAEDMSSKDILKPDKSGAQFFAIVDKFFGKTASVVYIHKTKGPTNVTAIIRGAVMKRCKRFVPGDVVIICTREFENIKPNETPKTVDLVHKYFDNDIKELRKRRDFDSEFLTLLDSYIVASGKGETNIQKAYSDYNQDNIRFSNEERSTFAEEDDDADPYDNSRPLLEQGNRDMPPSDSEEEEDDE